MGNPKGGLLSEEKTEDVLVVLACMGATPDLPCALDKHWHHGEWHQLLGADTVCVTGLPEGAGLLAMSIICLCLNPETEKRRPNKE